MYKKGGRKEIGLAVIGCGRIGRIRSTFASQYPGVGWIGVCDLKERLAKKLAEDIKADFYTTDYRELLKRPEVNTTVIAIDENNHVDPILAAVEQRHHLMIEKPLATDVKDSYRVLTAIQMSGVDAVVGYTNRFRRRFLAVKEKVRTHQIGEVTSVTTRAFMNRMAPTANIVKTDDRENFQPMVISGTHSFDISLWLMEGKEPVEIYARSIDKVLGSWGTQDANFGIFTMNDGTIWSMSISWALPTVWPGAVYGIEMGIVGTKGVITVDDTHRDLVLASEIPQGSGPKPEGFVAECPRHVDFLTSYPPGDMAFGQLWGPMREETNAWLARLYVGLDTHHATALDGHRNFILTLAMGLSAKRRKALQLPLDPEEFYRS
jgi:myo-inositol 2-dehydrogenase / D-chiro-inositol 1-dehydrogenase